MRTVRPINKYQKARVENALARIKKLQENQKKVLTN